MKAILLIESDIWVPNGGITINNGCSTIRPDTNIYNSTTKKSPTILMKFAFSSNNSQFLPDISYCTPIPCQVWARIVSEISSDLGGMSIGASEIRAVLICPLCTINLSGNGGDTNNIITAMIAKRISSTCNCSDGSYHKIELMAGLATNQCLSAGCIPNAAGWQLIRGSYHFK